MYKSVPRKSYTSGYNYSLFRSRHAAWLPSVGKWCWYFVRSSCKGIYQALNIWQVSNPYDLFESSTEVSMSVRNRRLEQPCKKYHAPSVHVTICTKWQYEFSFCKCRSILMISIINLPSLSECFPFSSAVRRRFASCFILALLNPSPETSSVNAQYLDNSFSFSLFKAIVSWFSF